jgi:hypothetical protein
MDDDADDAFDKACEAHKQEFGIDLKAEIESMGITLKDKAATAKAIPEWAAELRKSIERFSKTGSMYNDTLEEFLARLRKKNNL